MKSTEIRKRFLSFFEARGHKIVPSSSLVPANDPTLLFANAGMNQFKDVFLGREKRAYSRACSVQKCVRAGGKHNDLEQVGRTRRHHTFFEMLGNFSFGDYFKKDAVAFAWELLTGEFAISPDKLYATIFEGAEGIPRDAEAYDCWRAINVPAGRIFEMGLKDNFWQMGETGPCGPCSEIHYDMGPEASELGHKDCKFPCPEDCGRYVEIWNLVFMQFNKDESGKMTPLPRPSIDTGAGLERLAAVLEGKLSNFDTDLFRPLIEEAADLANVEYGAKHDADVSLRIIADHARAATFLISDGVLPSNEGRGYVLRRILRRALYHGQTLGMNEPFLFKMSGHVVEMMKSSYSELTQAEQPIAKAIKVEEERYAQTTRAGLQQLDFSTVVTPAGLTRKFHSVRYNLPKAPAEYAEVFFSAPPDAFIDPTDWAFAERQRLQAKYRGDEGAAGWNLLTPDDPSGPVPDRRPPRGTAWVAGADLFALHDTFGLRPDFVRDVVKSFDSRLDVDIEGYNTEMQKQRNRARASWKAGQKQAPIPQYAKIAEDHPTKFLGYGTTKATAHVYDVVEREQTFPARQALTDWEVILDQTPFYAESGGQVGDKGLLRQNGQAVAFVEDTYRPAPGLVAHCVRWATTFADDPKKLIDSDIEAEVDAERRDAIRRNHTATHLLHAALHEIVGTHAKQAGSLVAPDRLRFDFTHYASLGEQDVLDIEDLVNQHVLKNEEVNTEVTDLEKALESGAMALFGEKYGDQVRVVSIADGKFSKELCGGTHVRRTGDIGLFKILSESSVAAGTRRIEAITGTGVLEYLRRESQTLGGLAEVLRSKPEELLETAEKLAESEKKLRKQLEAREMKRAASEAGDLAGRARDVKGVRVIAERVDVKDRAALRQMIDSLRPKLGSGVIVLGSADDGKAALIVGVTKDLTERLDAGKIVREAAKIIEGSGGGRKDLAEAGGKNPAKLDESLQAVPGIIEKML